MTSIRFCRGGAVALLSLPLLLGPGLRAQSSVQQLSAAEVQTVINASCPLTAAGR